MLRWIFFSSLILGNAIIIAILAVMVYARTSLGPMMGQGVSVSELVNAYIPLIAISGVVGLLALAATSLYWAIGLHWISELRDHAHEHRMMKLSLIFIPLLFFLFFLFSMIPHE